MWERKLPSLRWLKLLGDEEMPRRCCGRCLSSSGAYFEFPPEGSVHHLYGVDWAVSMVALLRLSDFCRADGERQQPPHHPFFHTLRRRWSNAGQVFCVRLLSDCLKAWTFATLAGDLRTKTSSGVATAQGSQCNVAKERLRLQGGVFAEAAKRLSAAALRPAAGKNAVQKDSSLSVSATALPSRRQTSLPAKNAPLARGKSSLHPRGFGTNAFFFPPGKQTEASPVARRPRDSLRRVRKKPFLPSFFPFFSLLSGRPRTARRKELLRIRGAIGNFSCRPALSAFPRGREAPACAESSEPLSFTGRTGGRGEKVAGPGGLSARRRCFFLSGFRGMQRGAAELGGRHCVETFRQEGRLAPSATTGKPRNNLQGFLVKRSGA